MSNYFATRNPFSLPVNHSNEIVQVTSIRNKRHHLNQSSTKHEIHFKLFKIAFNLPPIFFFSFFVFITNPLFLLIVALPFLKLHFSTLGQKTMTFVSPLTGQPVLQLLNVANVTRITTCIQLTSEEITESSWEKKKRRFY